MHNVRQRIQQRIHRAIHRLSGGRIGNRMLGVPILFLTTVGRKTGETHVTPLFYIEDGDAMVVVASNNGYKRHPSWYHNAVANPDVTVEAKGTTMPARAEVADAPTKTRLWPQAVAAYKYYNNYQNKTDRDIPMVLLVPRAGK